MGEREDRTAPLEAVSQLIFAIGEGRVDDARALVHPDVVWRLVARPARSQYHGREEMALLIADLRAAYGTYRVEIDEIVEDTDARVFVLAHVVQHAEGGYRALQPSRSTFTFLDGLVVAMDAEPIGEDP